MGKSVVTISAVNDKVLRAMRSCRLQQGHSQEYVAYGMGVNQNTYSKIESGQTELTLIRVVQFCDIYEVDVCAFFRKALGEDEPLNTDVMPTVIALLKEVIEVGKQLRMVSGGEFDSNMCGR